jgi:2-amino-4-hydroxy-6-hydroxymethyldihydropteridine diphosphokinase
LGFPPPFQTVSQQSKMRNLYFRDCLYRRDSAAKVRKTRPVRAYVGVGANLGPRRETIVEALRLLGAESGLTIRAVSTLQETEPVGYEDQPKFINGAVAVDTDLLPRELLDRLLTIERRLGRKRGERPRFGPRTIDLDLLLYGDERIDDPGLTVPHPRLAERRFALEPLAELDPELEVPGLGPVRELLADA